jgi:hypothetical protein
MTVSEILAAFRHEDEQRLAYAVSNAAYNGWILGPKSRALIPTVIYRASSETSWRAPACAEEVAISWATMDERWRSQAGELEYEDHPRSLAAPRILWRGSPPPARSSAGSSAARLRGTATEATRRRLSAALNSASQEPDDRELQFVTNALELELFDALDDEQRALELRSIAAETFQIARTLAWPEQPVAAAQWLVRLGCMAVIGDRSADFRRIVTELELPALPLDSPDWGIRVWSSVLDIWLRLLRKQGWDDLDAVQERVITLRQAQQSVEPEFLRAAEDRHDVRPAWELMAQYHLAKAAEILGVYLGQGSVDGHYDIREQLEAQFDRGIGASARGQLIELETMSRLLARASRALVDNSIWTVTRAVNSRVTRFVESLTARDRARPIFEMLPPQRRTLREEGLLGSGHRSVVVSLPTSSGKTFIAEFRILQALNQFDQENGWGGYHVQPMRLAE